MRFYAVKLTPNQLDNLPKHTIEENPAGRRHTFAYPDHMVITCEPKGKLSLKNKIQGLNVCALKSRYDGHEISAELYRTYYK